MDEFIARTRDTISKHQMLKTGDTVIVALSGGADSMSLFRFLSLEREALGVRLLAAHVNHGIRGAASDADAAFVRAQCEMRGIPLEETRLSPPPGASEEWARRQRYTFFARLAERYDAKVATAHTGSDNAETVLFQLARGSSARGAAGIPPVRGAYIRPLLWAQREDVLAFLERQSVPYVTDGTNATDLYARNRVRHSVLPLLESVHAGAARSIARFAADMTEIADLLDAEADALLSAALLPQDSALSPLLPPAYKATVLADAPAPVRRAALARLIANAGVPQQKTSLVHRADALLCAGHGSLPLAPSVCLRVRQGRLFVETGASGGDPAQSDWLFPFRAGEFCLPNGLFLTVRLHNYEEIAKDAQNHLNFFADYDRIYDNTFFRTKRPGDSFRPAGRGVTKPLKKWFSEEKLPLPARAALPLLAREGRVLWAAGFGFADGLSPDAQTKTAVSIETRQTEEKYE